MTDLPHRIDPDAILEGIIELRFAPQGLPEIFLGRLLSSSAFQQLTPARLPQADIPISARTSNPDLRFQPSYQIEKGEYLLRIGSDVLSVHVLKPYPGWDSFYSEAIKIIRHSWAEIGGAPLERCALRYINALTSDQHGVNGIDDINLAVSIKGQELVEVSVSFISNDAAQTETLVRVASIKHVVGAVPANSTFAVDLEVRTNEDVSRWSVDDISSWLQIARTVKNERFFDLLPSRIIDPLKAS